VNLTHLARNLRKSPTDTEQILWLQLRNKRFLNYKFRRQFPIGGYIVDFICLELKLIIELDGAQHLEAENKDAERTEILNKQGFKVIRFWNNDVIDNLEGVLEQLRLDIETRV